MPARSDTAPRILGSRVCEICGVNRQTRDKWVARGLLRRTARCDQVDLVELVVLQLLLGTLKKSHVEIVWRVVQPKLRELMPGPTLTLVWDPQTRSAELALDDASIVRLARHGRPVQVLDLGGPVERAREAFRREVDVTGSRGSATRVGAGRNVARRS